ncbi:MAG: hypothetical protein C0511_06285 [Hyphomicrobium sp.]|nr:hypothetical protein [Hyphomicrobium sp.]
MILGRWVMLFILVGLLASARPLEARAQVADELAGLLQQIGELQNQGKNAEAIPLSRRALAIVEKAFGPDHPDVGGRLNNLAVLLMNQGHYAEAEPLYKRALAIRERALGAEHPDVGVSLNNLGALYRNQGRYAEAEVLYKRALSITEKAMGSDHPSVGNRVNNLAHLYKNQGRYAESEALYKRALAIREKALGPNHPHTGQNLNNLAELYRAQGRYADAEPLHRRALAIREKALGPDDAEVGQSLNNLASLFQDLGRDKDAEPLFRRALAIEENSLGPDHPSVGITVNNLALLNENLGRYAEAERYYRRALASAERQLGPDHPHVGTYLNNLGGMSFRQRNWERAAGFWRRSTSVSIRRAQRGTSDVGQAVTGKRKSEPEQVSYRFRSLIKALYQLALQERKEADHSRAAFQTAQWSQSSEAADSLAQMALRSVRGDAALSLLVRERQDLVAEWQKREGARNVAGLQVSDKRGESAETANVARMAAIDERIRHIDNRLASAFPEYAALARPNALSVEEVQSQLRSDEALVLFLDTPEWTPIGEETLVWVVTKTKDRWVRSKLGPLELTREVTALRCGLDATAWHGEGSKRCSDLLKLPPEQVPKDGRALPFDAVRAHALYKSLLGDAADLIKGKHLLIIPSGALTTLPFQVLVTETPRPGDLKSVRWLARDNAITVLPSVASLKALRRTAKPSAAPNPMIGFGNPLLDGDQAHPDLGTHFREQAQIVRAQTGCAKSPQKRTASLRVVARSLAPLPVSGRTADLNHLRAQAPLPETADELCEVARSVGGSVDDVRIGARATETEVKRLSSSGELAKYRILHFATHGTLAGQLKGTSEPGLILTPPKAATDEDDGYLSGSEIASLKLDADWVILSACNTAGGSAQGEAAEALSGLARVFFYAGARALLVSHWEVDSAATVKLITTAMAELAKDKSIGRAEAMRRAMLAVMADTSRPANWVPAWHPSVWGPFVVVGEGGLGR